MSTKSGFVPTTFTDAGTGQTFEGGQDHSFDHGAHANYAAAGLIGAPSPRAKPVPAKSARQARKKASTQKRAVVVAPTPVSGPAPVPPSSEAVVD